MERVQESVAAALEGTCAKVSDRAVWDDTYAFMADGNRQFVESNIVESTCAGMKVNLLLFQAPDGELKLGQAFDETARLAAPLPASLLAARIGPGSPNLPHSAADQPVQGILVTEGRPPLPRPHRAIGL